MQWRQDDGSVYTNPVRSNYALTPVGTAGGLGAIVLWSGTFALARSLSEQTGPLTAGAAVYLLGGLFCLSRFRLSRLRMIPRAYLLGCGFCFVFYTAAVYAAVGLASDRGQLLEIALLNYLWPTLTILFSIPLLEKKASWWLLPGSVLALGGIYLVLTPAESLAWSLPGAPHGNVWAYVLALAAAVAWALYSNLARRWSAPGTPGAVELFIVGAGLVLLGLRVALPEPTVWTARAAGEAAVLAGITATAYSLWDYSMRRGNILLVAACSYFTPLLSTLVSCLYLNVAPTAALWAGCGLLVGGSLLSWIAVKD